MGKEGDTPRRDRVSRIRQIDELCDRYEDEWQAGRVPDLASYLAEVDEVDHPAFRHALARIDTEYAKSAGGMKMPPPKSSDAGPLKLVVIAGPHTGKEFAFNEHDTFLVGRSKHSHFQLSYDDPYFSRRHFLVEVNPPRIRVFDLNSRNGISVNGVKQRVATLKDGDELRAGHSVFRVTVNHSADPDAQPTLGLPVEAPPKPSKPSKPFPLKAIGGTPEASIPGYQLEKEIGRGSMGTVYHAKRLTDGLSVAVKVISLAEGVSARHIERFLREAKILASLDHRHIVRFLESGQSAGVVYLAMELVDGPDASRVVKQGGAMDVPTAVRLMLQALEGLAHAHAKGFVHRDVKPANLLLGREDGRRVVKLADFGLSRCYEASGLSGRTLHGEVGGTPAFMAPEQVTHYREAKPAVDQYSAAATLYFLLTGKYALNFVADPQEQLVQIVDEKRVPIRTHRPELPEELAEVIHKGMANEAEDRYPDVTAFREALKPFSM
ncbi:MAG: hypothetical protein C0467_04715 [Planctomycetaceae bacterium]|nr:hypothetical protein [Planctomycetaceae bacterium]